MLIMKKIIMVAVLSIALLTGCSTKDEGSSEKPKDTKLTYSNLVDEKTQNEVNKILKENKIDEKEVDNFIKMVKNYNDIMGELKTSKPGFTFINTQQVPYDDVTMAEKWKDKGFDYMDLNCRLTSFMLFKDNIKSESKFKSDDIDLAIDLDTIKNNPLSKLSKEDTEKFTNLYAAIPVENSTDSNKHAEAIIKEWKNRKISFVENSTVSIINVFLHYPETNNVFVGHTGILIKAKDGLLFVEKYGSSMPYQVSKFQNKSELKTYLMDRLDVDKSGSGTSKPIIMENDNLMN